MDENNRMGTAIHQAAVAPPPLPVLNRKTRRAVSAVARSAAKAQAAQNRQNHKGARRGGR